MTICDNCGKQTDGVVHDAKRGMWVCEHCKMLSDPATGYVMFTDPIHGGIYSVFAKREDSLCSLNKLSKCGWFVRKLSHTVGQNKWLAKIEFHGRVKCLRVSKSYRGWPTLCNDCREYHCGQGGCVV